MVMSRETGVKTYVTNWDFKTAFEVSSTPHMSAYVTSTAHNAGHNLLPLSNSMAEKK